jgi:aerobic C4-dicarboxylate transport protein
MVIAGWTGQRDDARFRAALDDPSLVRDPISQKTLDAPVEEERELTPA